MSDLQKVLSEIRNRRALCRDNNVAPGTANEDAIYRICEEIVHEAMLYAAPVADGEPVSVPDDPMLDGTDGAHPAWWRGCDHGYSKGLVAAAKIAEKLFTAEFTPQEPGFMRGVGYAAQTIFDEINDAAAAPQPNPSTVDAIPAPRGGMEPDWHSEWLKSTRKYRRLEKAARNVVNQTDQIHDSEPWPQKYRAPYEAITLLRAALAAQGEKQP